MSFVKEFSYTEIQQRKITLFNAFISACLIGFILTDLTLLLQYYFFYSPVIKIIIVFSLSGFFFGAIAGRFIFTWMKNQRPIYILFDLLFIVLTAFYCVRFFFLSDKWDPLLNIFFITPYIYVGYIVFTSFILGIKNSYFLKVACGDFIDEKSGIISIIVVSLIGFSLGMSIALLVQQFPFLGFFSPLFPLLIIPTVFLIKLEFNPLAHFAKEFERVHEPELEKVIYRDTLLFTYLNFALIIIFLHLGLLTVIKFYGSMSVLSLLFYSIVFIGIAAGIFAGKFVKIVKKGYFYIYGEMLLPILFLLFVFALNNFHCNFSFFVSIACFLPIAMVVGILLRHTVNNVINNYSHNLRFSILEFSFFILPIPILLSLQLTNFTNLWFFIFVYVVTLVAILIPGLHLLSREGKGASKVLFFVFTILLIPSLVFVHFYFELPLDANIYGRHVDNFNVLKQVNYNAPFIKQRGTVKMYASPVFKISDSIIRNLQRSLVPLALYVDQDKPLLFIDGNQKFFHNFVIGLFKNALCLDILSEENVDFNSIPISGRQTYVSSNEDLLFYLRNNFKNNNKYYTVVDIPNLLDQQKNYFRFSDSYYSIIKKGLYTDGIFAQLYSIHDCRADFFASAVKNLKKHFKTHVVYLFSDQCIILSSNNEKAFEIDGEKYKLLGDFLKDGRGLETLFFNEIHVLSHLVFAKIDDLAPYVIERPVGRSYLFSTASIPMLKKNLALEVLEKEAPITQCISQSPDQYLVRNTVMNSLVAHSTALNLLKRLEYSESVDDYERETQYLFELQKYVAYRIELKEYVTKVLSYKEKYYYDSALRFESEKKWEDAKKLYNVVLSINNNNFDAHYRLGSLSITLQDFDNSLKHFNNALRIMGNHPKVLYQMGILYFMKNENNEAFEYFNKALAQKEINPSLYKYLGLCYEKMGNDAQALEFYSKAIVGDPNDTESKTRFNEIKKRREEELKKWETAEQKSDVEVEQGVEIPLPINKSAYDVRLKDNNSSVPEQNSSQSVNSTGGQNK